MHTSLLDYAGIYHLLIIMVLCNCFACFKGVWYCYFYFWLTFCSISYSFKECQNTGYLSQTYLLFLVRNSLKPLFWLLPSSIMLHHQTNHVDQTVCYSISMPLIETEPFIVLSGEEGIAAERFFTFLSIFHFYMVCLSTQGLHRFVICVYV